MLSLAWACGSERRSMNQPRCWPSNKRTGEYWQSVKQAHATRGNGTYGTPVGHVELRPVVHPQPSVDQSRVMNSSVFISVRPTKVQPAN